MFCRNILDEQSWLSLSADILAAYHSQPHYVAQHFYFEAAALVAHYFTSLLAYPDNSATQNSLAAPHCHSATVDKTNSAYLHFFRPIRDVFGGAKHRI